MTQQRTPHHVTSTEGLVTNTTTHKRCVGRLGIGPVYKQKCDSVFAVHLGYAYGHYFQILTLGNSN